MIASPYFFGPCSDRADGLAEGDAEVGEPVLNTGRDFGEVSADDDAVAFQGAQRAGEYLGGQAGDGLAHFGEPQRTALEGEDDERRPLVGEAFQAQAGGRSNTVIGGRLLRHSPTVQNVTRSACNDEGRPRHAGLP